MKTFEEALQVFSREVKSDAEAHAKLQVMAQNLERYIDLSVAISNDPDARIFIQVGMIGAGIPESYKYAVMNLFINGVIVGMEMERQELPGELENKEPKR